MFYDFWKNLTVHPSCRSCKPKRAMSCISYHEIFFHPLGVARRRVAYLVFLIMKFSREWHQRRYCYFAFTNNTTGDGWCASFTTRYFAYILRPRTFLSLSLYFLYLLKLFSWYHYYDTRFHGALLEEKKLTNITIFIYYNLR